MGRDEHILIHLLVSFFLFFFFTFFMFLLDVVNARSQFFSDLNEIRHNKLKEVESPSKFHRKIWSDKVICSVESHSDKLFFSFLDKEAKEILNKLWFSRLLGSFDCISVNVVLFRQCNGEFVFLNTSVKVS